MRWLLYVFYLLQIAANATLACMFFEWRKVDRYLGWTAATYFGLSTITSLSIAKDVALEKVLVIDLRSGATLWGSFPRIAALVALCFALNHRRRHARPSLADEINSTR